MTSSERPAKRAKLLSDSESSDAEPELDQASRGELTINEDFARRFEHNKKREEKDRLEEKYGKASVKSDRGLNGLLEDDEDSSEDESEDDDAELATKDLDAEIEETLAEAAVKGTKKGSKVEVQISVLADLTVSLTASCGGGRAVSDARQVMVTPAAELLLSHTARPAIVAVGEVVTAALSLPNPASGPLAVVKAATASDGVFVDLVGLPARVCGDGDQLPRAQPWPPG